MICDALVTPCHVSSGAADQRGALLVGHVHQVGLHRRIQVRRSSWFTKTTKTTKLRKVVLTSHRCSQWDGELQLHAGQVLPAHPSAVQQQRKARYLHQRTAKGWGHPPGVHHSVSRYIRGLTLIPGRVLVRLLGVEDGTTHTRWCVNCLCTQESRRKGNAGNHCLLQGQGQSNGVQRRVSPHRDTVKASYFCVRLKSALISAPWSLLGGLTGR